MKRILWVLLLALTSLTSHAQTYKGGTVQIVPMGSDSVEIRVTALRNCVTCSLSSSCDLPSVAEVNISNDSTHKIALELESAIAGSHSPSVPGHCTKCQDESCRDYFSYMIYTFTGILHYKDIPKSPDCFYTVTVEMGRLDEGMTTIVKNNSPIIIKTTFNGCLLNSTPHTSYFGGVFAIGRNANQVLNSDPIEASSERIIYSLAKPMVKDEELTYKNDFEFDRPLEFLGFPKAESSFPPKTSVIPNRIIAIIIENIVMYPASRFSIAPMLDWNRF